MSELRWQKSSFSGPSGSNGECIELTATDARTLHLRESDTPNVTLSPSRPAIHALLKWQKSA
ncbi:DUF397 domain-containing protein [Streptomyces hesseae]|uniref:DUF397 domain-containing protein n=1 Tax=Streptomyces hesseae TaxID=3075519 RepID=A0ABU2SUH0_9ACTN|nr:DUF397 domain-containing protein [Streptomyces sp. DSM 40473]MDT0452388.1 DUF397 domain-containing protein [Streptomyces sp. DSM 40473]